MALEAPITSRRHPLVARLRAAARGESDEVLLDGPHLLDEALRSATPGRPRRCEILEVVVTHQAIDRPDVATLCDAATRAGLPVRLVPGALATAISPARTPAGVVTLARIARADLTDTLAPSPALLVVMASVQDPGNVGTIVRSAEAAGATGAVVLPGTADPLGWKALRASMGSALRLPLHQAASEASLLAELSAAGVAVVVADNAPAASASFPDLTHPLALVVGAEGAGVPASLRDAAAARVRIDIAPSVESLNAAMAATVILLEARRQRLGRTTIVDALP